MTDIAYIEKLYTSHMYQIPKLLKFPKLFHAFSTKADGNMANSILGKVVDFENVLVNREKFLQKIGMDIDKCVCMWVTHGDEIIEVPRSSVGSSMKDYKNAVKVDGLMTDKKGICLFLLVADCLPIIFYDPKKKAIALIHAGWKGVDLEIAAKAVVKMKKTYGCDPLDIIVGIGPCAHKESFIKDNPDQKTDPRWKPYIDRVRPCQDGKGDVYKVDLLGYTREQLMGAGILAEHIHVSGVDTVGNKRYFSHVRENSLSLKKQGRFACVVGMK